MLITRLNAGFWLVWFALFTFSYFNSYDDPTSIFYDHSRAYEQKYSLRRAAAAISYLEHLPDKVQQAEPHRRLLCIGIPSINRTSESFLANTIASLTDTLTPEDRASVHLIVLLADKSPENHFAYGQPWLAKTVDEVLLYAEGANHSVYRTVPYNVYKEGPGRGTGRVENMRLDHSLLLEACRDYGSPYFALVEDDIIASPNWFTKLKNGLEFVESRSNETNHDWIYLRLFYSELILGWNDEEWPIYAQNIFIIYTIVLVTFLARMLIRRRLKHIPTSESAYSSAHLMALILGLWLPALIILYFVAGRISMSRLNPSAWTYNPAREMPNYGCCAQGLVFPQRHLENIQALLRNPPYAFAGDQILEDFARDHSLAKWTLEPSVLQHVGLKQSSAGDMRADVWNFSFERQHRKRKAQSPARYG